MVSLRFRFVATFLCISCIGALIFVLSTDSHGNGKSGETLFNQHCKSCHPDGGNIINPKRTLGKKDREANGIKTKDDIVTFMRKPGPGMTPFDSKILSDKDAKEIAEYIQKTFK